MHMYVYRPMQSIVRYLTGNVSDCTWTHTYAYIPTSACIYNRPKRSVARQRIVSDGDRS